MAQGDLISPDRPPLEAVQAALRTWFRTQLAAPRTSRRIYRDSFDGLLRQAGKIVWFEDGRHQLANLDAPDELDADADSEIARVIGVRALLQNAELELRTETINVLDRLDKTIARVHIESPLVIVGDARIPLTARIRVAGLRGYARELAKVRELLERSEQLQPAAEPLADEAIRVSGGRPGGQSSMVTVRMAPHERGDLVVARVLKRLLQVMDMTLPGTIADIDSEFLHDYRVAVRRTRSVLKEMPGVFLPDDLDHAREEFRWLQEITGPTRDLDVWLLEFDELAGRLPLQMRTQLDPLKHVVEHRHATARAQMERALRSERTLELHDFWAGLLEVLVLEDESQRPTATTPIGMLTAKRIRKVHSRMVKMGRAITPASPPQDYHDLRKRGKELRYLLELFGARLYEPDVVKPMVKALKGLQNVLGRHQDREVQIHTLKQLASEVMDQPDGAHALMAIGVLVQQLETDAARARSEFFASFETFASEQQIELVHRTFR